MENLIRNWKIWFCLSLLFDYSFPYEVHAKNDIYYECLLEGKCFRLILNFKVYFTLDLDFKVKCTLFTIELCVKCVTIFDVMAILYGFLIIPINCNHNIITFTRKSKCSHASDLDKGKIDFSSHDPFKIISSYVSHEVLTPRHMIILHDRTLLHVYSSNSSVIVALISHSSPSVTEIIREGNWSQWFIWAA